MQNKVSLSEIRREYFKNLQEQQRQVDKELRRTGRVRRNITKRQWKALTRRKP